MTSAPKHTPKPPSPMRAMIIHHTITALTIAGVLALGVWGYLSYRNNEGFFYEGEVAATSPLDEALIESQRERLKLAVRAFFEVHDNYPATLDELVNEGWLKQSDLSYPNGKTAYKMKIHADEVTITASDASQDLAKPEDQPGAEQEPSKEQGKDKEKTKGKAKAKTKAKTKPK